MAPLFPVLNAAVAAFFETKKTKEEWRMRSRNLEAVNVQRRRKLVAAAAFLEEGKRRNFDIQWR